MSLEQALTKWAQSAAGQQKIRKEQMVAYRAGKSFGAGSGMSAQFYADAMIEILNRHIAAAGFTYGKYLDWVDVGYNSGIGQFEVHVNFEDNGALERPSWYPQPGKEEIDNIAALMNTGYEADGYVYTTIDGQRVRSAIKRPHDHETNLRPGSYFMQAAVAEFNARFAGQAVADLSGEYEYRKDQRWVDD